ncbi:AraC family transcriptional regulator [Pseudobacter ginsenosidimutans]|uniref:AraC-like DNA-binding protein n=1 Tax=Pseudobacter ginsenosidimutans TaxID=661488 RepID=A0A4Q7MZU4_9BACT|nr:AraC family transcriptional regulator [Pseudobacter ginsenosidimutans]QEC43437.1 AraC family transcriptional regulator [Pseudobacter ginsenosidimutans]RZS74821.1 AraC-like DNA-binding protein [Pseudobacter ginsenosidimutans]
MRPQLLKVSKAPRHSFSVRQDIVPYINNRWHYHPEIELIHFKKGEGTQFIGDNIKRFKAGDIVLVGPQLPHYWRFDDKYFEEGNKLQADVRVVHFAENFWGDQFLQLPENVNIKGALEKARRGLQITGKTRQKVAELLELLLSSDGSLRIMLLIEALNTIAECKQLNVLSSIGFKQELVEAESDRVNAIYDYSLKNFKRKIQLEEIAAVANISPNSFCRYFKSRTRKTYSQFLIEIRVGQACKLLIENNLSIKQLCYESGFNNFTSFHKYFKMITGKSPLNYQKEFMA